MGQQSATIQRLAMQSRDTAPRGRGSKAARRLAELRDPGRHLQGLTRGNKAKSRAQQRLLFARYGDAARQYTSRGRYRRLPERVTPPTTRSAR